MATTRRLRNALAAAVLAAPLVALPVLAPQAAAAHTLTDHPDPGYGWGIPYAGRDRSPTTESWTDASYASLAAATAAQSAGVVLVETQVDYGTAEAAGTGLVLTSDGTVITNHHVVQGATAIRVTVPGTGRTYDADVVGYDATHDVAVLRLRHAAGLTTVATDPSAVTDGESVTAVGNAEGAGTLAAAGGTVTKPRTAITVTEEDGSTARLRGLIETDADVVSGDSGGALLDAGGEVVGMNVAASSGSTEVSGYAIPIRRVLDIAARILAGDGSGPVKIGYDAALGVQLYDGSTAPLVAGVVDGGAAATVGLTSGSVITGFDGEAVSSVGDLVSALADHRPGDRVSVSWTDASGARRHARLTLGRAPVA